MRKFASMRTGIGGTVLAAIIGLTGVTEAQAHAPSCCRYVKVVTCETKIVPYIKWITIVDDCGYRRKVKKRCYRHVRVPVVDYVKICH